MSDQLNYTRLSDLSGKVKSGLANKQEENELVDLLYSNKSITKKQYDDYRSGVNSAEILNAVLAIGAIVLVGYLISKIVD